MNRQRWANSIECCFWPGCRHPGTETHEIVGGPARAQAMREPASWLKLCHEHHEALPSRPGPELMLAQLAMKRWHDPERYALEPVLRLWRPHRGRWDNLITDDEVVEEMNRLFDVEGIEAPAVLGK